MVPFFLALHADLSLGSEVAPLTQQDFPVSPFLRQAPNFYSIPPELGASGTPSREVARRAAVGLLFWVKGSTFHSCNVCLESIQYVSELLMIPLFLSLAAGGVDQYFGDLQCCVYQHVCPRDDLETHRLWSLRLSPQPLQHL